MFQIPHVRSLARIFAIPCIDSGKPDHIETFHAVDGMGLRDNEYVVITYHRIEMDSCPTVPNLGTLAEAQKVEA